MTALPEDTGTAAYQLTLQGGGAGWTAPLTRLRPPAAAKAAVLYVCAEPSRRIQPALPMERAEEEGLAFAALHRLDLVESITDPFGEPDPQQRAGWLRVRELAETGRVATVIDRVLLCSDPAGNLPDDTTGCTRKNDPAAQSQHLRRRPPADQPPLTCPVPERSAPTQPSATPSEP